MKGIGAGMRQNKLLEGGTIFFMAASAMLLALTVLLLSSLAGAIDDLMNSAQVPDYIQMHGGDSDFGEAEAAAWEADKAEIARFAESRGEVREWQICPFLNLDNRRITLGGMSLADSTQDNGLCVQGGQFDFLLDLENRRPEVLPGQVYVPVCYRSRYDLSVGDVMALQGAGDGRDRELMIAGFLRDAQMNSMMASSKRFLVNEADYESIRLDGRAGGGHTGTSAYAREEYLIEFLLWDDADTGAFGDAYAGAGLPAGGPAIMKPLIRLMAALSDGTMILVIFLVSIVVLLISMLCIRFLLLLQLERDRKEVGLLKALGVGRLQIRRLYLTRYLLFALCGALFGLPAAFLAKAPLEKQIRELYGAASGGWKTATLAFAAVWVAEGIILLAVRRTLKRTDRLTALEALFSTRESGTGTGQYRMIGFVAAACAFLVLVPQNLYTAMSAPAFVTYMGIGQAQIRMDIRQTDRTAETTERIAAVLGQDLRVEQYAVLRTVSCTAALDDGRIVNLAVETGDHGIFPVQFGEGRAPAKEGEIALSAMNAEELGLTVGDRLQLTSGTTKTVYSVCGIYADITNGGKTAKAYRVDGDGPVVWSVLYVSLTDAVAREAWMTEYRQLGADVIDLAAYVQDTYGQTLAQIHLASVVAMGTAVSVIAVVVLLFVRLIVEENRYLISLYKALGFTGAVLKRAYFVKGMLPAAAGLAAGFLIGGLCGERLCAVILRSFGADGFRFVIDPVQTYLKLPALLVLTAAIAVWTGVIGIRRISACECCSAL